MTHHDEELHLKAVELVREAYDMADKMRKVNLDALNEPRPATMRYHAQYEVVMELLNRAGAMLEFAGQLGPIDSEENGASLSRRLSSRSLSTSRSFIA
jgi:hypothetical protein